MKGGEKMKNKKGLSNVIATVLIVLLTLAAVAIVWSFVQPSIQDTGTNLDVTTKCLNSEAVVTSCDTSTSKVKVQYKRGDDVVGFYAVVKNSSGATTTNKTLVTDPGILLTYDVALASNVGDTAEVAVIVLDNNGNEKVCEPSQTVVTCV